MTLTKNVTKNVSSLAHEAAHAASDLGGQAVEFGRNAADLGMDAASTMASNVAAAASQLAETLASKAPSAKKRRSRAPMFIVAAIALVVAYMAVRARRTEPAATPPTHDGSSSADRNGVPSVAMAN